MSEGLELKCRKCGTEITAGSNYCNSCGARIYDVEKLLSPRKFSLKLAFYSSLITFVLILLFSFFTAYFYTLYDQDIMDTPEKLIIVSMIGPALGIFISSFFITYIFNPIRIKETVAGAGAVIILFKLSDFILASVFTKEGVVVALISCLIAFAGAWLGFYFKKKIKFKN
ncbi:MAG TPA: zinc-ribbon domain-containing protein [Spirochaetota bacterium]|nr:zinc-ribbon domain-containing protein [Spirochaetota bacterium]HPJ41399.1 zinc-ribbon domain-containing protein [Spirochaetota bacterium]HPR38065.1 zinc-ribbon domain-containing protein [Spirochaetota bacterium]HRX48062.1 zinc-ribbon domain-containing protein [Spirochaetota bacterium]